MASMTSGSDGLQPAGLSNDKLSTDVASNLKFAEEMEGWVDSVLEYLGWTREHLEHNSMKMCPNDPHHYISVEAMDKHLNYCQWLKKGYTKKDLDKALTSTNYLGNSNTAVPLTIDEATLSSILGRTGDGQYQPQDQDPGKTSNERRRQFAPTVEGNDSEFTSAEKRLIYDYCVQTAKAANKQISIPAEQLLLLEDSQKGDRELSGLELKAMQRDLKRRRQSYRGKNVHTGKKSHTEIIREVIVNQMDLLSAVWEKETRRKRPKSLPEADDRDTRSRSRDRSRRRSGSRDRSRGRSSRRSKSRERSRDQSSRRSKSRERSSCKKRKSRSWSRERHKHKKHKHHKHHKSPRQSPKVTGPSDRESTVHAQQGATVQPAEITTR